MADYNVKAGDKLQHKTFTLGWLDITVVSVDRWGLIRYCYDHKPDWVSNRELPHDSKNLQPRPMIGVTNHE